MVPTNFGISLDGKGEAAADAAEAASDGLVAYYTFDDTLNNTVDTQKYAVPAVAGGAAAGSSTAAYVEGY